MKGNIIYKALSCHMSQKASSRAIRLINGDQVFWLRRTDNRIYEGKVSVSSGNGDYLHDFMMMNTEHITARKPAMENYLWVPEADDRESGADATLIRHRLYGQCHFTEILTEKTVY